MPRKKRPAKLTVGLPHRLPLAGQSSDYEARMRQSLIASFKPADPVEEMWIEDIAYCAVAIEHDRAMIAAFLLACLRRVHAELTRPKGPFETESVRANNLTQMEVNWLHAFEDLHFTPRSGNSFLDDHHFAMLLGQLTSRERYQLRQLQTMLHQELMERDRIINQLQRSRRQAMFDALEIAERASRSADDHPLALTAEASSQLTGAEGSADTAVEPAGLKHAASASLPELVDDEAILEDGCEADPDHTP